MAVEIWDLNVGDYVFLLYVDVPGTDRTCLGVVASADTLEALRKDDEVASIVKAQTQAWRIVRVVDPDPFRR